MRHLIDRSPAAEVPELPVPELLNAHDLLLHKPCLPVRSGPLAAGDGRQNGCYFSQGSSPFLIALIGSAAVRFLITMFSLCFQLFVRLKYEVGTKNLLRPEGRLNIAFEAVGTI